VKHDAVRAVIENGIMVLPVLLIKRKMIFLIIFPNYADVPVPIITLERVCTYR